MRKLHFYLYRAKDGIRWHMKRSGRIIAESGEAYERPSGAMKTVQHMLTSIAAKAYQMHGLPALLGLLLLAWPARAQVIDTNTSPPTFTGPGMEILNALATGTNWVVAPFGIVTSHPQHYGGGLAGIYNMTPTIGTMLRVDYAESQWWMPSASVQLQVPITIASNVTITPFGFSGIAIPIGGAGQDNHDVAGIFGSGMDFKFPKLSSHWSVAFDVEYWSNRNGVQWRFSPFVWRF